MTHRERILAAISHEPTDRVPMDLGGTRDTSIVMEGYERLARHLGVDAKSTLCDKMMRLRRVNHRRSNRNRRGYSESGPGSGQRHGPQGAQQGIWWADQFLGRCGQSASSAAWDGFRRNGRRGGPGPGAR